MVVGRSIGTGLGNFVRKRMPEKELVLEGLVHTKRKSFELLTIRGLNEPRSETEQVELIRLLSELAFGRRQMMNADGSADRNLP